MTRPAMGRIGYSRMPKIARFLTGALTCSAVTVFLASTASATITTGNLIEPHSAKYVSDGNYGVRSDNFGSLTWLDNQGERGFRITRSTADRSRVTAYPNVFRGWQWGAWHEREDGTDWYLNEWQTKGQGLRVTDFSVDS